MKDLKVALDALKKLKAKGMNVELVIKQEGGNIELESEDGENDSKEAPMQEVPKAETGKPGEESGDASVAKEALGKMSPISGLGKKAKSMKG